jgi:hypothetical protein
MITSFEVGAVFKILDEASPTLRKVLQQVRALNDVIEKTKVNLQSLMASAGIGLDPAIAQTRALAVEWRAVSRAAQGAGRSLTTAAAASARAAAANVPRALPIPGRGGFGVGAFNAPVPGGHAHFRVGSNAAMVGMGALGYGAYEEAELEDAIFQMKFHAGLPDSPENTKYFRNLIQNTASQTGFHYKEIAEAATDEIRLMKGAGGKESGGLAILPEMLHAAAIEARVKPGTTLSGAMDALIQSAHMAQDYGVNDVKGMAPLLAFLSTANPATMPQMVRAASYAMPTLRSALGVDPADVLLESTALARAGATNTKSGTWLQAAFERALPPDPRFVKPKTYQARIQQMRAIGLVDDNGKSTVLNDQGKLSIDKLVAVIQHATATMDTITKNSAIGANFGKQGARGIFLLTDPNVVAANAELKREYPEFRNRYGTFMDEYATKSPLQSARVAGQDLTNVLADIGSKVLPPVVGALRDFDGVLVAIKSHLPGGPSNPDAWGTIGKRALEFGAAGAVIGTFVPIPGVGTVVGGGVGGLVGIAEGYIESLVKSKNETGQYGSAVQQSGAAASAAAGQVSAFSNAMRGIATGLPLVGKNPGGDGGLLHHMNYVPSHGGGGSTVIHTAVHLNHRQVGEAVTEFISDRGGHATEGSAYHDGTWGAVPSDMAYSI